METQQSDGTLAQILLKMGEMGNQLAAIGEQLKALPDHEARIRGLESTKSKLIGASAATGLLSGGVTTAIYWALTRK